EAVGGEGHLCARRREAPRRRQIDPPTLASTGPTKRLRYDLTFRLRIPTNQGHLERTGGPDHVVVFWGRRVSKPPLVRTPSARIVDDISHEDRRDRRILRS